jgi:hypothetical protein
MRLKYVRSHSLVFDFFSCSVPAFKVHWHRDRAHSAGRSNCLAFAQLKLCRTRPNSKLPNVSPLATSAPHFKPKPHLDPVLPYLRSASAAVSPPRRRKSTSGSSISAMHLDGVDDELGGGSCAPSPARFELQEDPSFWKDNNVQVEFYPPQCELPPPDLPFHSAIVSLP